MTGDDGGDAEERSDGGAAGSDAEPRSDGEPDARVPSPGRRGLRSSSALYFAGFSAVLISFAALALGGLALLGRGIDASPTGFFWASIVLSIVALGLALAALFAPRGR